jgi:hypothetical protein
MAEIKCYLWITIVGIRVNFDVTLAETYFAKFFSRSAVLMNKVSEQMKLLLFLYQIYFCVVSVTKSHAQYFCNF